MEGEWKWLQFWRGKPCGAEFRPGDYPSVAALEARWSGIAADQEDSVATLTEDQLKARSLVRGAERSLADTLQHLLTHSIHHRGQVVTMLRQTGYPAPALDFLVFLAEST